jgi:hypothetical protein
MTRDEAINKFRNNVDRHIEWNDFEKDFKLFLFTQSFEVLLHEIYEDMEQNTCDGCMYHYSDDGRYPIEPCCECSRFFGDCYQGKR